jgi:subtilisin family serine protease
MGGAASKHWAKKVNEAYEKGIFIVSAAGNNFGRTTPRTMVYPARFKRVVAACGVTYDYSPYYKPFDLTGLNIMQGNFGPRKVMHTAIAAFTPNVPWAKIGCHDVISLSGAGTSSATPQVASAAALYYQKYYAQLEALPQPWMKVEAIRQAMFTTALKKITGQDDDIEIYFGNGVLQANKMLSVAPDANNLKQTEKDDVRFPLLFQILSELSPFEAFEVATEDTGTLEMYETELAQLIQESNTLQRLLENEEKDLSELSPELQRKFFDVVIGMPQASTSLKKFIMKKIGN